MLNGKNIFLRALEPDDLQMLYRWENDANTWKVSDTITPFSKYTLERYIEQAHQDIYTTKQLRLMICLVSNNEAIGTIDLFDFDPINSRAGVGVLIASEENRKHGYASEALKLFINYAFGILKLHQLFCNITIENEDSLLLFKKHDFSITGIKKSWVASVSGWKDEYFLQLIKK
ncbi:MAG: GNAT family protein [Bacteroidia bacterium]